MRHAISLTFHAMLALIASFGLSACSFLEAAGEITLSAKDGVPKVATDLVWPSAGQLLGNNLGGTEVFSNAPAGIPSSLGAATLAHVQGLMTIDGECQRSVLVPTVESKVKDTKLRNLRFELTNCYEPTLRCVEQCAGFRGMKIEARLEYMLLDETTAKRIRSTLSDQTNPAAIVQVRVQFAKLNYFEPKPNGAPGERASITKLFAESELGLASLGGEDDTVVVTQRYLGKISPTTPQRFEIDPKAAFTRTTKEAVLAAKPKWIEIFQRIDIAQPNLYAVTLGGGGVELEFQPEFVISALEVAKGAL